VPPSEEDEGFGSVIGAMMCAIAVAIAVLAIAIYEGPPTRLEVRPVHLAAAPGAPILPATPNPAQPG